MAGWGNRKYTAPEEAFIGRFCVRARRRGVRWKRLERRFGLGRKKLWQLATREAARSMASAKVFPKHLCDGPGEAPPAYRAVR